MVRLPIALPYVASAFAIEEARTATPVGERGATGVAEREELANLWRLDLRTGASTWVHDESSWSSFEGADGTSLPDETLITEHHEFARRLMSVPAVQASALAADVPPFFVDGDRLVASTMSLHGVAASDVERGMSFVTSLARCFPWDELEIYRADAPADQASRSQRFFRTFRHGPSGTQLERWVEASPTRTGLRRYERTDVAIWSHPYEHLIRARSAARR